MVGVAIQMVIEGGKLTYHHLRNAVFTATGEPDGTFSDIPQVDRTLRGTSHYLIMRWMRRLARLSSERLVRQRVDHAEDPRRGLSGLA